MFKDIFKKKQKNIYTKDLNSDDDYESVKDKEKKEECDNMNLREEVLKVSEGFQKDIGYGRARIDNKTRTNLGISVGEIIEIEGTKKTVVMVLRAHPTDEGKKIIRIDNLIRKNSGTKIGEVVTVRNVDVKEAKVVILAPIMPEGQRIEFGMGIGATLKKNLLRRALMKKDELTAPGIAFFGNALPFLVVDTNPDGAVLINEKTNIRVSDEPVTSNENDLPIIDEVGGLDNEIFTIKETIGVSVKHPEIFMKLGVSSKKSILIYGKSGVGKSSLVKHVFSEMSISTYIIGGYDIVMVDDDKLNKLLDSAEKEKPSVVILDNLDIAGEKYYDKINTLIYNILNRIKEQRVFLCIIVNNPDFINPDIRKKFDVEMKIGIPDREGRKEVIHLHTMGMPFSSLKKLSMEENKKIKEKIQQFNTLDILKYIKSNGYDKDIIEKCLGMFFDDVKNISMEYYMKIIKILAGEILLFYMDENEIDYSKLKEMLDDHLESIKTNMDTFIYRIDREIILDKIADDTDGFTGADIVMLVKEFGTQSIRRYLPDIDMKEPIPVEFLENMKITIDDINKSLEVCKNRLVKKVNND